MAKKKVRKIVEKGRIYITSTFNNTIITVPVKPYIPQEPMMIGFPVSSVTVIMVLLKVEVM